MKEYDIPLFIIMVLLVFTAYVQLAHAGRVKIRGESLVEDINQLRATIDQMQKEARINEARMIKHMVAQEETSCSSGS